MRIGVRFKTQLCDSNGKVERDLQEGFNTITDWGMDSLASKRQDELIAYLHLSDTLGPVKRVATGGATLSVVVTSATSIDVTCSAGFFSAGDVGNTLSIDDFGGAGVTQELKITTFTDSQHVTCSTRQGAWLPGFTPGSGPFSSYGVHFTSVNTLANQTTKFNTYDTSASNYSAELNDTGNSRTIHQRIYLSGTVSGSAWTVNQLGWSDGAAGDNVFGKVNLAITDTIPVGKKYRVTMQLYSAKTPVDISSQSVNWGATIGTYDLAIRQEVIEKDSNSTNGNSWLNPKFSRAGFKTYWWATAKSMNAVKWDGDSGFNRSPDGFPPNTSNTDDVTDSSYVSGSHTKTRTWKIPDSITITAATKIVLTQPTNTTQPLAIRPNSGTITKPSGYWCALSFQLFWTRSFTN